MIFSVPLCLCGQCFSVFLRWSDLALRDVAAVVQAIEVKAGDGFIGFSACRLDARAARGDAEHTPARRDQPSLRITSRAGVKDDDAIRRARFIKPADWLAALEVARITARRGDDANG